MNIKFASQIHANDRTGTKGFAAGHRQLRRRGRAIVATVAAALMVASCSVFTSGDDNDADSQNSASQDAPQAPSFAVDAPTALSEADPSGNKAAQYFFPAEAGENDPSSKELIVAGADEASQYAAAQAAVEEGAPMLIVGAGEEGEQSKAQIVELAPEEVIQYGVELAEDPALAESDATFTTPEAAEGQETAPATMAELLAASEYRMTGKRACRRCSLVRVLMWRRWLRHARRVRRCRCWRRRIQEPPQSPWQRSQKVMRWHSVRALEARKNLMPR